MPDPLTVTCYTCSKSQVLKHLGLWDIKPRPPPRMAKAQRLFTEPHIDYSD